MSPMKMIVGLGNPGPRYIRNRHNIGFQCLDTFAMRHHIEGGRKQSRAMVLDAWITVKGLRHRTLLVKPLTYMNASGEAVGALARFYQIEPDEIIVVHDDLDMDAGKVRLRRNGSSGGQNGIKSIIQHLGTPDFNRLKVGIGRPPGRMDPAAYVLQDFVGEEDDQFNIVRETVCDMLDCWLADGMDAAMNQFNG